jgi:hypothetical protein
VAAHDQQSRSTGVEAGTIRGTRSLMADAKTWRPPSRFASGSGWQVVWGILLMVSGVLAVLIRHRGACDRADSPGC